MSTNSQSHHVKRARVIGWPAGTVGGLLLVGLGLELAAHQMFGQTDVATLLLAVYLGFWFSVLGIAGFLVLSTAWLVRRPPVRADGVGDPEEDRCLRSMAIPVTLSGEAAEGDESMDGAISTGAREEASGRRYAKGA
ncbi:MAG TPA: hypothetical protein VHF07_05475 [Nitrospiraceae bacterium]|nr:hypothetical protein [Nitrospiraceae bacterium]